MRFSICVAQAEASEIVLVIAASFAALVLLALLSVFFFFGRHWIKAMMGRVPVSFFDVIGMVIRGANVGKIIDVAIASSQAGHPIAIRDLMRADGEGLDIEAIALADRTARDKGKRYSMDELITAARESKLQKLLDS